MDADPAPDPRHARIVAAAAARLEGDLSRNLPGLSHPVRAWLADLSHTDRPADYFLHPQGYPLVQIPLWLLETAGASAEDAFAGDLVYAGLSGYYYLRLVDNLMDGHATVEREILPAANFFQLEAREPFTAYFDHAHRFWERYRDWWFRFAEATWQDGVMETIDREAFETHAAQKTCPEQILIAAACFRAGREDLLPAWTGFAEAFGRWHQMGDDLRDWPDDLKAGRVTYFLSEAARRTGDPERVPGWAAGEGLRWGAGVLDEFFEETRMAVERLGCPPLERYLAGRKQLSDQRIGLAFEKLKTLTALDLTQKNKGG